MLKIIKKLIREFKHLSKKSSKPVNTTSSLKDSTVANLTEDDRLILANNIEESLASVLTSIFESNMVRYVRMSDIVKLYGISEEGSQTFSKEIIDFESKGWERQYKIYKMSQIMQYTKNNEKPDGQKCCQFDQGLECNGPHQTPVVFTCIHVSRPEQDGEQGQGQGEIEGQVA